jgi:adenine deaminase
MGIQNVSGNIIDVLHNEMFPGTLKIDKGRIVDIKREKRKYQTYIIPGFVDSHIHIESSLLPPSEFARLAVIHGTVAVVCDPHEIANVMGVSGVLYMLENSRNTPLKITFGAPSSVPSTPFESTGAKITVDDIEQLFKRKENTFLSEVMDVQGVLRSDPEMMKKIQLARQYKKRIDGHAPGLSGSELKNYVKAGITTDHESTTRREAEEKIRLGVKIQIREGSVAQNFDALNTLIQDYPDACMFCCDDILPHDLARGHINEIVKKAIHRGADVIKVLKCASVNPVLHYELDVGLLQKGDSADFLEIDNLHHLSILKTFIKGEVIAQDNKPMISRTPLKLVNNFCVQSKKISDFLVRPLNKNINVIEALKGQLVTRRICAIPRISDGNIISDTERDILKIAVVNRYQEAPPSVGFIKSIGLKKGAIASSIAHDSHNIIAVGVSDKDICRAVNLIIEKKGGVTVVSEDNEEVLPLPIAGIMSEQDGFYVAQEYERLNEFAQNLGSQLRAPFMTLSFMALPVIPEIKLTDKGLFDTEKNEFINLFAC